MKYILVFLLLLSGVAYGQTTYFIRADTTKLQKVGASNELVLLNDTRDTLGALVNIGGGKTAFMRGRASGDTLFLGRDTIIGIGAGTVPSLFARTDTRNETGSAMAFSAAGQDFGIDSVANMEIVTNQFNALAATDDDVQFSEVLLNDGAGEFKFEVQGAASATFSVTNDLSLMKVVNSTNERFSEIRVATDSITLRPGFGNLHIDSLDHIPNPGTNKMMVWDSATGHVATRLLPTGGGSVTDFIFTDGDGFDGTVTNSTSTPTLAIEVAAALNGAILYSNAGALTAVTVGSGLDFTAGTLTASATAPNLSYDAANHEVDISGGGTSATIPLALADGATEGLASFTANDFDITAGNVSIDYVNGQAASATLNGFINTSSQTIAGNKTFSGTTSLVTAIFSSALTSSPSGTSVANLGVIGAGASAAISGSQFQVEGATNTNIRMYMYGSTATTLGVGNNYGTAVIGASALTEPPSGNVPLISSLIVKAPTITGGASTVTNTATVYIEGAPSATVTGVNTALTVAAGGVRFGGIGGAGMVQSDADGDLSVTTFTALTTYTPTLTGIGNVTSLTAYATNYIRMGNMFWIFGEVEIEPTSTGATSFGFSLPVSTEVANSFEWAGTASDALGNVYKIFGDIANERVTFESVINSATTQKLSFTIMGKFIAP